MLDIADIRDAAQRLRGVAHRTPVLTSRTLDAMLGARVFMKAEHLQRMGAFKFRGAYHALSVLTPDERARGVVAFSSGNHAQAVALAARLFACPAKIVMPADAPAPKVEATRGYGADVVLYDRYRDDRAAIARRIAGERGAALIPPYDHLPVMAGQGTCALELIEDVGPLDALIVCAGGGGLLSGCAVAARALAPAIEVFGAEPEAGDDMRRSLHAGHIVTIEVPRTICDGQQTTAVGVQPFEVIRTHVSDVLTVSDAGVVEAMRFAFERMKQVLEPSGACALAALMHHAGRFRGRRVGVTLSGGNIGVERFVALVTGAERAA
ncbi:threo-3-hydroxy-L-aspartate ammonia-lyase [Azohydromonas sp.]|uniref:threo-3-hydroxy-L-aspartate ammonia-lyase n=1 Tax=Azohydromonas sp. TaxID=1872666 RepID=UPI002BD069B4|nr:threo-3-hydroxy-L-aspartate ammonia-lyase [Azohydromonas sp.]HMM85466.1 threo-3-hydroxy-L-aspartate ammonia-lyase [Azohydromonas sp.]